MRKIFNLQLSRWKRGSPEAAIFNQFTITQNSKPKTLEFRISDLFVIWFLVFGIFVFVKSADAAVIYSEMNAETGNMSQWHSYTSVTPPNPPPSVTQTRVKNGVYAFKYEIIDPSQDPHSTQNLSAEPNKQNMGSPDPNNGYVSGYYSWWMYVDAGFIDSNAWTMILGWMTGVSGAPSPISHIELVPWKTGPLQLRFVLKNCTGGQYTCPSISGYELTSGYYHMTASSPAGIVAFPRNQWVHIEAYYKMAPTNGQVIIWQDGVKIMDLTAPSMNTFGGHSYTPLTNSAGDMTLQFGYYGGRKTTVQRFYVDDFKVSDMRLGPGVTAPAVLSGDLNGDRIVNSLDWSLMSAKWLTADANADLNKDGAVNSLDWSVMSSNWLKTI